MTSIGKSSRDGPGRDTGGRPLISLVVPAFNEEQALPHLYRELSRVADRMPYADFEFVVVDDGSTDRTHDVLRELNDYDARVRFICFSRNFGKEAALLAGLRFARGDFVAPLDADLQDPPGLLVQMYDAVGNGEWDCAAARRRSRSGEARLRSGLSDAFYRLFNRLGGTELVRGARDFRLMSRQMVDAVLSVTEYNRFSKGIFAWVGYRTKWIEYENAERVAGETKWSLWGLLKYSMEAFVGFSTLPLSIASAAGIVFCAAALVWVIAIVAETLVRGNAVPGWASLACIVLFASGVQLFCIGILGQYLAKTYLETKQRPSYIVRETERDRFAPSTAENPRLDLEPVAQPSPEPAVAGEGSR